MNNNKINKSLFPQFSLAAIMFAGASLSSASYANDISHKLRDARGEQTTTENYFELGLGLAWAFWGGTFAVALSTVVLMGFSAIGVILAVSQKQHIQCACLGTVFNLPMSTVTIIEDGVMILMAAFMLYGIL